MNQFSTTLRGVFMPEEKRRSDYAYVPFEIPFDAARLEVRYRYSARMSSDEVEGGNVIDIGLFDPRGHDFPGGAGFRGWSGSARDGFFLTPADATPGYLPGPLPAGRYAVILGLYRIWDEGAEYEVEIQAEALAQQESGPSTGTPEHSDNGRRAEDNAQDNLSVPAEQAPTWYRGDLQSHTYHSDAKGSPQQLVDKARALGLDFLAITDHNTISHHAFLAQAAQDELLLIPGQEVTTYYGHMNVWGTDRWCDFRAGSSADMAAIIELAHSAGGVCSINHPKTGGPAWEYSTDLDVQAMEVWQGPWPHRNEESLALWDRLLLRGAAASGSRRQRLPLSGGGGDESAAFGPADNMGTRPQSRSRANSLPGSAPGGAASVRIRMDRGWTWLRGCGDDSAEMGGVLEASSGHADFAARAGMGRRRLSPAGDCRRKAGRGNVDRSEQPGHRMCRAEFTRIAMRGSR